MNKLIVFAIILAIGVPLYIRKRRQFFGQSKSDTDISRPSTSSLPNKLKENDKIVLIKNVMFEDLKKVLTGFCNMYNKETYQAFLRLTKLSGREFAITFPYNINFEIYCYLINYIQYPMELKWNAEIVGWATTKSGDKGIVDNCLNKKIMLFIPEDDSEYDSVYFTTSDNIGYKFSSTIGKRKKQLDTPKKFFAAPIVNISDLTNEFEDFK